MKRRQRGSNPQGIQVSRVSPEVARGRQVTRVTSGVVVVEGSLALYGNDVRVFRTTDDILLAVMADQLPRWWHVKTGPAYRTRIAFTSPGYVVPLEGAIISGADIPQVTLGPGSQVDIATSHPFSIFAEFGHTGVRWNPAQLTPLVGVSKIALPAPNPDSVIFPVSIPNLIKTSAVAAISDFTNSTSPGAFPTVGGITQGIFIEGVYGGAECDPAQVFAIQPAPSQVVRDPIFLVYAGLHLNPLRTDIYYIGDIAQQARFFEPFTFRIVFGRSLMRLYSPSGLLSFFAIWSPHLEIGSGGLFSRLALNFRMIGFPQADVTIPLGSGSGPLAGQSLAGLQGQTNQAPSK
jgi:hypothetical protein